MPEFFVINLSYQAPLEEIDRLMPEHLQFLRLCYEKQIFLVSGRKNPRTGGIILAKGLSIEQFRLVMSEDPFVKTGAATVEITEFSASQAQPQFAKLFEL
jgi:uncharacterized protein YciI